MRLRFSFARLDQLKYLSHLELMRLMIRAFRRAALPLEYSRGFNPHPLFSIAAPLPVGVTAEREFADLSLSEPVEPALFLELLSRQLPAGIELAGAGEAGPQAPSAASLVNAALYLARQNSRSGLPAGAREDGAWQAAVDCLLGMPAIVVKRRGGRDDSGTVDIRPLIISIKVQEQEDSACLRAPALELLLRAGSAGGISPFVVLGELGIPAGLHGLKDEDLPWQLHRCGLYIYNQEGGLRLPLPEGGLFHWIKS